MMLSFKKFNYLVVGLLLLAAAASVPALTVNGAGQIGEGWNFTPFQNGPYGNWLNPPPGTNQAANEAGQTATIAWAEGNNVSPVNFQPHAPAYIPAPGGAQGEKFDMEFLAWRTVAGGTRVQVLGITSVNPTAGALYTPTGRSYHAGDLFIDKDNNAATGYLGFDTAITTANWSTTLNDPLHSGGYNHNYGAEAFNIADVSDVHGVTNTGGFGSIPAVAGQTNPFTVRTGNNGADQLANAGVTVETATFDYGMVNGQNENGTWIIQWEFNIAALGLDASQLDNLKFQWTVECGNDVIVRGPRVPEPKIPEPATIVLLGLGLTTIGLLRRRFQH